MPNFIFLFYAANAASARKPRGFELYVIHKSNLKFYFTKKDVEDIVDSILIYDQDTKNRVKEIVFQQMRKYQYLMKKIFHMCL